ncbi:MAG: single-stranded DNA-binding protein [Sphingomonadales bacterium]
MTNLVNSVRLIGNVGRTPEVKEFGTGRKKASMSLATTEKRRNESGEYISHTEWHNLICWGKQADVVERFVKKGSRLAVEGKLTNREYTGSDGQKRYITEIVVHEISFFDGRKAEGDAESTNETAPVAEKSDKTKNKLPF